MRRYDLCACEKTAVSYENLEEIHAGSLSSLEPHVFLEIVIHGYIQLEALPHSARWIGARVYAVQEIDHHCPGRLRLRLAVPPRHRVVEPTVGHFSEYLEFITLSVPLQVVAKFVHGI